MPSAKLILLIPENMSMLLIAFCIASAAFVMIWQPSGPYTLYPLYFAGLWLAVTTMPPEHPRWRTAKERAGVGMSSGYMYTFIPFAAKTDAAVSENRSDLILLSCPIATDGDWNVAFR